MALKAGLPMGIENRKLKILVRFQKAQKAGQKK